MQNQHSQVIKARIDNWQNRRSIVVQPDSVLLQVTSGACNCETCYSRVRALRQKLVNKPELDHAWVKLQGDHCLVLPRQNAEDPIVLLRNVLEVTVEV